jgi:hypothetical protein
MAWCIIYFHDNNRTDFEVFGPFASEEIANEWYAQTVHKLTGTFHILEMRKAFI